MIDVIGDDEFSGMAANLNRMAEDIKQLMEKEKLSRAEFEAIFEQEAQMTGTAPEVSGEI